MTRRIAIYQLYLCPVAPQISRLRLNDLPQIQSHRARIIEAFREGQKLANQIIHHRKITANAGDKFRLRFFVEHFDSELQSSQRRAQVMRNASDNNGPILRQFLYVG